MQRQQCYKGSNQVSTLFWNSTRIKDLISEVKELGPDSAHDISMKLMKMNKEEHVELSHALSVIQSYLSTDKKVVKILHKEDKPCCDGENPLNANEIEKITAGLEAELTSKV
jgi:recombinational DNA repair protein RecR